MKKLLLCTLIAILALGMLPVGALAKTNAAIMFAGDAVKLGTNIKGVRASKIAWSSSDEEVVKVEKGRIRGIDTGRSLVKARYRGKTIQCDVVVLPKELRVPLGEIVALPRSGAEKYSVENARIAAVSKQGQVLGIKAGVTRLGVKCGNQRMVIRVVVEKEGASGEPGADSQQSAAAELDCADSAEQIVLVDYKSGSKARLSVHEKQNGLWKQLYSCTAYVGRNGINKKREGDGKTPTGTYNLTQPFGIKADPGAKMEYTKVTKYHYWCGSSNTKYYNQLVDERKVDRKHSSSDEYLINYKGVYNYCMFIDYNASGEPAKGSCIFLHCKGSKNSTSGCIAVSEKTMKKIIRWAKPGCKIVIR